MAIGIAFVALVFVFVSILSGVFVDDSKKVVDEITNEEGKVRDSLTGAWVEEQNMPRQVFGVVIDNNISARPQSGIDKAFLVVESPVEAGIPRLLAFFDEDQDVKKIGPVRSARPYFLDWNNELDSLFVHVGGSNEALDKIA